ncbi:MAG: helix-turn-helix domain-containing protein [archaeon]
MLDLKLKKIGLTDYESRIYLALLDIGEGTSGDVIKKAEIHTGKIYEILESLKNKGLISEITKNNIKQYSATEPKRIFDYLNVKKKELETTEKDILAIMPLLLEKVKSAGKKPLKIEVYTGFEGFKTALLKEMSKYSKNTEVLVFGIQTKANYDKKIRDFFSYTVYPERKRKNVLTRKIKDISSINQDSFSNYPKSVKYLEYKSLTIVEVYKDLVMIEFYLENPIVLVIEGEEVANNFKSQFEMLWKMAKNN